MRRYGTTLDISLTISPVKDATDHVIGPSKVVRDTTGRKRAEEALRELKQCLEATLCTEEIATWTWDIQEARVLAGHLFSVT
jgi:PAS domain-containing protein